VSLFWRPEARSIDSLPWSAGGPSLVAGSAEAALRLIPFYSATTGIADDISTMPWRAFRDSGEGWGAKLAKQPALLTSPGVGGQSFIPWMNQAVMSMLTNGFAFGVILALGADGWPSKIAWVHPQQVQIDESGATPVFRVNGRVIDEGFYVYIPGPVMPGSIVGLSPVALFRLQMTKGIAAQRYAAAFFDQGIMPPGVLRNKARTIAPGDAETAKVRFKAAVAGRDIFVTGNDWEWNALSVPNDDAAFLETIKASATEIAAIFRVQPEDIGGVSGSSLTYATLEMNELKRNRRALMPWVRRLEEALTNLMPRPQYVKANMDHLARADLKTRTEVHEIATRIGLETNPEARALEDRAPLTPDEIDQWQNLYGKRTAAPVTTSTTEGQGA
jgi:HK97 family phage portal protein